MKSNTLFNAVFFITAGFGMVVTAQAQTAKVGSLQIEKMRINWRRECQLRSWK